MVGGFIVLYFVVWLCCLFELNLFWFVASGVLSWFGFVDLVVYLCLIVDFGVWLC